MLIGIMARCFPSPSESPLYLIREANRIVGSERVDQWDWGEKGNEKKRVRWVRGRKRREKKRIKKSFTQWTVVYICTFYKN